MGGREERRQTGRVKAACRKILKMARRSGDGLQAPKRLRLAAGSGHPTNYSTSCIPILQQGPGHAKISPQVLNSMYE